MTKTAESPGRIVLCWWKENLRPDTETGAVRGFRARLRRADAALEALAEQRVIALHEALGEHSPRDPLVLAALAQLMASIEANKPQRIARIFGGGDQPTLSNLRFQRLIRIKNRPELAVALCSALPLIDNACNVAALAEDFLFWSERIRIRWCFDYFGKASPDAPASEAAIEETE
jgi:CRISPR system Cascade subunit CasB